MSFIDAHDFPAGLVLRVLGVAESTYYDRRARKVALSRRELDDVALLEQICKIRAAHEFAACRFQNPAAACDQRFRPRERTR